MSKPEPEGHFVAHLLFGSEQFTGEPVEENLLPRFFYYHDKKEDIKGNLLKLHRIPQKVVNCKVVKKDCKIASDKK